MKDNGINNRSMLRVGTLLRDAYRIVRYLSSGGFGNTYVAINQFDETKAIKEFYMRSINSRGANNSVLITAPDSDKMFREQLEKFQKEAKRLRKLHNEHIVAVDDMFAENGTYYYVMDYIDGESIGDRLKRTGAPIPENEALRYFVHILDALREVHGKNFFHLDIKPANILVDKNGNVAKLIDFGASKQIQSNGTATRTAMCYTPGYAPSEQVDQQLDNFGAWTDLYALGATLYSMLTAAKPPMSGDIIERKERAFVYKPSTSQPVRQLVETLMQPSRRQRPQNVDQVYALMRQLGLRTSSTDADDVVEVIDAEPAPEQKPMQPLEQLKQSKKSASATAKEKVKKIKVGDVKRGINKSKEELKTTADAVEVVDDGIVIEVPDAPDDVVEVTPVDESADEPIEVMPVDDAIEVDKPQPNARQKQKRKVRPQPIPAPYSAPVSQPQPARVPYSAPISQPQPAMPYRQTPSQGGYMPQPAYVNSPSNAPATYIENESKPAGRKLWIIIGSAVAAILAFFIIFAIIGGSDDGTTVTDNNTITVIGMDYTSEYTGDDGVQHSLSFTYDGATANGIANGYGKGTYDDGIYEGQYVDGHRQGPDATFTYTSGPHNGDIFKGKFNNDQFQNGSYYDSRKKITFNGDFRANKPYDGEWTNQQGGHVSYVKAGSPL